MATGILAGSIAGVLCLGAAAATAQEDDPCAGRPSLTPVDLLACLRRGPVDLTDVTIEGPLDLSAVGTISQPFRCVRCTFIGDVIAADVTFERLVALDQVVIDGDLDARGARFAGAVLARGGRVDGEAHPSGVRGDADFSLARFEQALQLDGTTFDGSVTFEGARFEGSVSMSGATLRGPVSFERIVAAETFAFDGPDPLNPDRPLGSVDGPMTMRNATFDGDVDLGARRFRAGLVAAGARVEGRFAIRSAVVEGEAELGRMIVGDLDATGLEVTALDGGGEVCARPASARGRLDLSDLRAESITLAQGVVDELVLQGAQIEGRADIDLAVLACDATFDGLAADSLALELSALDRAGRPARLSMLETVEDSAREGGDLELANEASYRRFVELNEEGPWIKRALDTVFYRGLAGYWVKPLRPLLALLALLAVGTAVRVVASPPAAANGAPPTLVDRVGVAVGEAGRAIVRPTPRFPPGSNLLEPGSLGRLAEYLGSKVLLVILVIAVSNNSSALDQIVDAVLS